MGITEIILIVVSGLLFICVVCILVLLMRRNHKNQTINQPNNQERYAPPVNDSQVKKYMQPFTVFKGDAEGHPEIQFAAKAEDNKTAPIGGGGGYPQESGGLFFHDDFSKDSNKTEMLLGGEDDSPMHVSYGAQSGITVQYYKNGATQSFRLTGNYAVIGRDPGCDIMIDSDAYMSKQHALLIVRNGAVCIADLNSKNGTTVNEKRIEGIVYLNGNEQIKVASSEMKVIVH